MKAFSGGVGSEFWSFSRKHPYIHVLLSGNRTLPAKGSKPEILQKEPLHYPIFVKFASETMQ